MSDLFWLTGAQMRRLGQYFPKSRGRSRLGDGRVLSGMIFANRNDLRWCNAPDAHEPATPVYNHWVRWSRMAASARMLMKLALATGESALSNGGGCQKFAAA